MRVMNNVVACDQCGNETHLVKIVDLNPLVTQDAAGQEEAFELTCLGCGHRRYVLQHSEEDQDEVA